MATSSRTWFYTTPEPRPYYIEERVNHTLWKNCLQGLTMSCTQATSPILMEGKWHDEPITFEWKPGDYFILKTVKEHKDFIGVMRQILMLRPAFSYKDRDGNYIVEWHTDGGEKRLAEIKGNSNFQGLQRLR